VPVSHISNALGGSATTTSFSITLPTTQAGDIIILEFTHRGTGDGTIGGTYSGPAFTQKHSQLYATSTFSGKTLWSRCTGNHAGETVTGASLTNSCAAFINVYRGAKASGDPLAAATIVGEQNASGNETQAQITTTVAGAYVVLVVANSPDVAVTSPACTTPGALTTRAERLSTGGTDTSIIHASAERASAGATGAFTWAQTDGASGSWAYAIEPEPAPTRQPLMYTAAPLGAAAAVAAALLGIPEVIEQPNHDQLHEHRYVEPGGHFLVDHVVARQRDRQSDPIRIDHAGRYYLVAGRVVEEAPPPVTGTSLVATQAFRQRDKVEVIRPTDHFKYAALYGRRLPGGHYPLPYAQYRIIAPQQDLPPTVVHDLHAYRAQPAQIAPQRLPYWVPRSRLSVELEQIRPPVHSLHAYRSAPIEGSPAVTGTSLIATQQFRQRDQLEEIRSPDHSALLFIHGGPASGHFLVDHVQFRQRDQLEEIRSPDHSALLFIRGGPVEEPPAVTGTSLIATQQFRQRQPTEQIRPSDHFKYAALYGRTSAPVVSGHYVVGYTQHRILDPVEEIRPRNHNLLHEHRHERVWWEFIAVAETDGLIQLEEIRPNTRHAERLFPHRQITAAAVAAPQRLWFWKPPTRLDESQTIRQPQHDLHAFRGEQVWFEYVESVDYSNLHPVEEIKPDTRHAAKLFPHRQITTAAVAAPQRLWFWKPARVADEPENIRPRNHDLLHQFRNDQIHIEYIPSYDRTLAFPAEVIQPNTRHAEAFFQFHRVAAADEDVEYVEYITSVDYSIDHPAEVIQPNTRHAEKLFPHRQITVAPPPAPQRLWLWKAPTRLDESQTIEQPHHDLHAFRGEQGWWEYFALVDYRHLHPVEEIRPNTRHADKFFPYRSAPPPVAPPQRVMYWPQPSRLVFAQPPDPRPIDHAERFRLHRQFALPVAVPQRLWFWTEPRRFEADELIGPVVHSPYRLSTEVPPPPPSHGITPWPLIQIEVVLPPDPRPIDHALRFYPFRQYLTGLPTTNIVLRDVYFTQQTSRSVEFTEQANRGVDFTQQANRVLEF
jgi:hypothetical protein